MCVRYPCERFHARVKCLHTHKHNTMLASQSELANEFNDIMNILDNNNVFHLKIGHSMLSHTALL